MLITLEGIDGSGKTSAREFLQERRADIDATLTFTREPTESWYGEAVQRSIRDDEADPMAELFLYTADHAAHLAKTVQPALDRGEVVVSDRYSDSRYAYQGATLTERLDDSLEFVREIHQPWTRPPDATIYLDVDAETGAERSGATNKFERVEQLRAVRENYERLLAEEPDRFVRIDATRSPDAVRTDVLDAIETVLEKRRQ
ncbi:dTMP kinase [Halorhabdus salina]|uniref:dTMP kinase n=1 Tax=Halorhabdus salina TaxID=2750670 RepID=UPI0015EE3E1D|nr:dTMP kinase [Halorhabdus salina]